MDEIRSEKDMEAAQPEKNPAARPEPRRRRRRRKTAIPMPRFLTHLGEDVKWYYDVRLWSPLILVLLILALLPGTKQEVPEKTESDISAVSTEPTQEQTEPTEAPVNPEAAALARLADSVGAGRSDNVKTIIMWVAINRSEDGGANGYGKSLLEEIARPNQWQGYDENAPYSAGTYAMALNALDIQARGGLRPLDSDMLWLVLNDDGSVTLRNQFTATATQKWREKTVK